MCGIAGSLTVGKKPLDAEGRSILRNLLFMNMLRGVDATGVVTGNMSDPSKVRVERSVKPAHDVFTKFGWGKQMENARWSIVHTRAATIGIGDPDATHPFVEGPLVGVHNGTVHGTTIKFPHLKAANDSHAIYMAMAEVKPDEVIPILKRISTGAYAMVWYDNRIKALRFVRNKERPLWFYKHDDTWFWASEPGMLAASIAREQKNPLAYTDIKPWQLKDHVLVTIPINGDTASYEKFTVPKVVTTSVPVTGSTQRYSALTNGIYQSRGTNGLTPAEYAQYENWWEEQLHRWSTGQDNTDFEDDIPFEADPNQRPLDLTVNDDGASPRTDAYPRGQYETAPDGTVHIVPTKTRGHKPDPRENGWITVKSVDDVWHSPAWAIPYRVTIFREMRWLFDIPKGGSLGSTEEEFATTMAALATKWGNQDEGSVAVAFNAQHIDLKENIVYGALTIDHDRVVPIHGFLTNGAAAAIKVSKKDCAVDDKEDMALLRGDLKSLKVYCNGELGFEVANVELLGWEPRSALSVEEEAAGSYSTHPLRTLLTYPDMVDWTSWR